MSFYSTANRSKIAALLIAAVVSALPLAGADLPFLLDLPGIATLVRYVPGSLDRAAHAQLRFELLIDGYASWAGARNPQTLYVLDRESWEGLGVDVPYGMPMRVGYGVALAAAGDDGTVALWRGLVGDALPTSATGDGMALRSTPSEVGSLALHDLMAEVEVARLLAEQGGFAGESGWIDELIAHVVARTAFLKHEEGRLPEIDLVFTRLRERSPGALPLALGTIPAGRSPVQLSTYQGRFADGARIVVDKDGLASVKKLFKLTRKGKQPLTQNALFDRYPELAEWYQGSFDG